MTRKKTREEHVAELAVHGRVELVGGWVSSSAKTLYRCLRHGEVHEARPNQTRRGSGLECCRRVSVSEHEAALSQHGRVELVGGFTSVGSPAVYRCLVHNETHKAIPSGVARGCGLACCKSLHASEMRARAKLEKLGRVELSGPWFGTKTKTLFRCKEHGQTFEVTPGHVLAGGGLTCCRAAATSIHKTKPLSAHLDALTKRGRVDYVSGYVNGKVKAVYRCRAHGELHKGIPSQMEAGRGLRCCLQAGREAYFARARQKAASTHERLISGRLELLQPYAGPNKHRLYRCLIHGETHRALPTHCGKGHGLKCCRKAAASGFSGDTLENALAGKYRFAKTEASSLYIYELTNHPGYLKPGIAKDCDARADAEYGAQVCSWEREHRTLVFLPEQVLLKATRLVAHCPSALAGWVGATEVRRMEADALVDMAQELMDELDACANPWEFAIAHGLLTPAQEKRARVLIGAGVISEAELASVEVAA